MSKLDALFNPVPVVGGWTQATFHLTPPPAAGSWLSTWFGSAISVTSLSPDYGSAAGGTATTITGTGFTGAVSVLLNGQSQAFVVVSDTTITVASTSAGSVGAYTAVSVTSPAGTASANLWTYLPAGYRLALDGDRPGTLISGNVHQWPDQSGTIVGMNSVGSDLTYTSSSSDYNGHGAVTSATGSTLASSASLSYGAFTMIGAIRQLSSGSSYIVVHNNDGGVNGDYLFSTNARTRNVARSSVVDSWDLAGGWALTASATKPFIFTSLFDGTHTDDVFRITRASQSLTYFGTGDPGVSALSGTLYLAANQSAALPLNASWGFYLLWDSLLSTSNYTVVETFLSTRFNL